VNYSFNSKTSFIVQFKLLTLIFWYTNYLIQVVQFNIISCIMNEQIKNNK